jgi:prephenate dehydrogenase
MWRDICVANKEPLLTELARYMEKLGHVRALIEKPGELEKLFAEAREARERWIRSS